MRHIITITGKHGAPGYSGKAGKAGEVDYANDIIRSYI